MNGPIPPKHGEFAPMVETTHAWGKTGHKQKEDGLNLRMKENNVVLWTYV